jgi:hypothetical protein
VTASVVRPARFHELSATQQAAALPEIGRGLSAQLETLSADPTPWGCEVMASNLDGARRAVLRLREALMASSPPDEAA